MADKNPVRGMQPMDEYSKTVGMKELAPAAVGPAIMGAGILAAKKKAESEATQKKARETRELEEKNRKEQEAYSERLKQLREREMKERGLTAKQWRDEANKTYGTGSDFKKGGKVKSASARADGCAIRGKTRA